MADPRTELGNIWRAMNREIHARFRDAFRGSDLNPGSMFVLRHIREEPGVTVSELARRVSMVKSHISKMIEQLSRQGYLEKRPDPADQRLIRIFLTPAAEALIADAQARAQSAWAEVMNEIPEEQLPDVMRGLRILLTALEQANAKSSEE